MQLAVIIAALEPTNYYASQIAFATKKSGIIRLYVDPNHFNTALRKGHYGLPVLDDVLVE